MILSLPQKETVSLHPTSVMEFSSVLDQNLLMRDYVEKEVYTVLPAFRVDFSCLALVEGRSRLGYFRF